MALLAERLKGMGHSAVEWYPIEAGIEDYFMKLTNERGDGKSY